MRDTGVHVAGQGAARRVSNRVRTKCKWFGHAKRIPEVESRSWDETRGRGRDKNICRLYL